MDKKLRENPAAKVKFARIRINTRTPFCDEETVDRLLERCARPDLKFVLFCGFHAGCRKEETIEARAEWFDFGTGLIHLQRSATSRGRFPEAATVSGGSRLLGMSGLFAAFPPSGR